MKPVDRREILPLGEYEAIRERFRARVIEEKRARRVAFGDMATCVFENHDTVLLQVQEMLRTERITKDVVDRSTSSKRTTRSCRRTTKCPCHDDD